MEKFLHLITKQLLKKKISCWKCLENVCQDMRYNYNCNYKITIDMSPVTVFECILSTQSVVRPILERGMQNGTLTVNVEWHAMKLANLSISGSCRVCTLGLYVNMGQAPVVQKLDN